ncbi:hypothetical protein [Calycomorphotria hydatis]|uniref:Uncharacterized protein n=1 Tax=Calycomorphotria hydatis TaxID=2528027 RepID=A0A517T9J3_9PLAN|nr:hypothetical protein [Calycomorphotria hydatis]QDT65045.1 hypothetical protein V22_22910 [Calycomorphotria hydatis]
MVRKANHTLDTFLNSAYRPAWEKGSGVPVSLSPGKYSVTGQFESEGKHFLELNDTFRICVSLEAG